jgi:predicted nuclease of predicted toxin-antitoxin system
MPWRKLSKSDAPPDWDKRVRILADENLGSEVIEYLREKGHNIVSTADVELSGKSDEDIAAYAWREGRMIWTHDSDFLKDTTVPEHRNPGVLVLTGGSGDQTALGIGLYVGAPSLVKALRRR